MPTYRKGLYQNTEIASGIQTSRDDSAVTTGYVTGVTDDIAGLVNAANTAKTANGTTHPNNSSLPLRRIVASAMPPNKALVRLEYSHKSSGAYYPTIYSFANPAIDVGHYPLTTYVFLGTAVDPNVQKNLNLFKPVTIAAPMLILTVPVTLSANALASVNALIGQTNASAVTWGGATFAANTVLFEGPRQRIRKDSSSTYYDVTYVFKILQTTIEGDDGDHDGWVEAVPNGTADMPKVYNLFNQASFAGGAFPTS